MSSDDPHRTSPTPDEERGEAAAREDTAQPASELPIAAADGEEPFGRLHPTSLFFDIISHIRSLIVPALIALWSAASGSKTGLIIAGVVFVPTLLRSIIRYLSLKYRIRDRELVVTEGIFFRRIRTVPVDRIQNIDLVQNVLHRLFGVAEVRVETASGTEAEATLRVLSVGDVEQLRASIFRSRQAKPRAGDDADEPVDQPGITEPVTERLLSIPARQLVRAGLASNRGMLLLGFLIGVFFQFDEQIERYIDVDTIAKTVSESTDRTQIVLITISAVVAILILFRLLGIAWYLHRFHGYQLTRTGDDLRITCGLFTRVSATVPRPRIQFISIHRNLLMRWMRLAAIRIETAGGSGKESEDAAKTVSSRWFIPVLPEARVAEVMEQLRPGLNWREGEFDWKSISPQAPRRLSRLAVLGSILIGIVGFAATRPWGWTIGVAALPVMIFLAIKKSRSKRYARTNDCVVYRSGIFTKKTSVTFFEKIQTVRLDETPFDRRWKMASLCIDTAAAGPADHRIHINYLTDDFARREFDEIVRQSSEQLPVFG